MLPTPSSSSTGNSPSSMCRSNIEYRGWWMSSGTLYSARAATAARVCAGS